MTESSTVAAVASGIGPAGPQDVGRQRRTLKLGLHRFSGLYVWALLIVVFCVWSPHTFATTTTVKTIASGQAITGLLALAGMIPLVVGVFDLSVAQMMGLSAVFVTWLQYQHHVNALVAIFLTLLLGLAVGVANAFLVVRLRILSLIATLGMTSVLTALVYVISTNDIVSGIDPTFIKVGQYSVGGITVPLMVLILLAAVLWYVLEFTPVGRFLYATGSNPVAARLSGLATDRQQSGAFILSAVIATLTGIIFAAQVGSASLTAGPSYLLPALSAVFLGGTQILPGRFNVPGTLVAVYLLATGVTGLELSHPALWINDLFTGVTLLAAVGLAARGARKAGR